jgi:Fur family transcriptional regulator, ferric uptake regulator
MPPLTADKLASARSTFSDFLRDKGLRQTPERFKVFDEVYSTNDHFDADELYVRLKSNNVNVSRATVYNSLELLLECDLVVRHQFGDKQAKYERSFSFRQHDHLICTECGELFEFCDPRLQSVQEMVSEVFDFEISHHSLHMFGTCRKDPCPNKTNGADHASE